MLKFLISLCICYCLLNTHQNSYALQGGQAVNASKYPGQVMISYASFVGADSFIQFKNCSGILLQSDRILTTTNCIFTIGGDPISFQSIPASSIYIHPVSNGEIGLSLLGRLTPDETPNFRVSTYAVHPQNTITGSHNLAILYLSSNINLPAARVYNGQNNFIGHNTTALGWASEERSGPFLSRDYYVLNKLSFAIVNSDTNINGLCYDSFVYTGTYFCGGYRNATNFMDFAQDEGAPIYKSINGQNTVIGLLENPSFGLKFEGVYQYEEYARVSAMINFIKQHAPRTQFWNENNVNPSRISITPILQLLLLDE